MLSCQLVQSECSTLESKNNGKNIPNKPICYQPIPGIIPVLRDPIFSDIVSKLSRLFQIDALFYEQSLIIHCVTLSYKGVNNEILLHMS